MSRTSAAAQVIPDSQSLFATSGILSEVSGYCKKKFARTRPYNVDARVQPCIEKPGGAASCPGTHAEAGQDLGARICARLLKEDDFLTELALVKASLP